MANLQKESMYEANLESLEFWGGQTKTLSCRGEVWIFYRTAHYRKITII